MNKEDKHISKLLPDYLDNLLDGNQKKMVEAHLTQCVACAKELSDLEELFRAIDSEEEATPPPALKLKFLEQLEEEKKSLNKVVQIDSKTSHERNQWANNFLKIAASVLLLVGAFLAGKYYSNENSSKEIAALTVEKMEIKQTAMLSMMESESASKRIRGVNYMEEISNPEESIIQALTDRMLYDENTNVRAAALDVLADFRDSETVKNTFIKALGTEKDPSIQIAIIQILGQMQEKKAAAPMQELMEKEDTQPFVKEQIKSFLPDIT
ncbi:HEAT repeat domain-containing protein [Maribacter halichondriae]|uniref:HEAT repeat domain-containing protein n=1 Tax=Maribacter halichondriae TaxID=2980554 RepID=UPI002359E15E|nr:HEAT repeat domain-containing protein [Maribacter sp. Hal144]